MAKLLSQMTGMPQMGKAFAGWLSTVTLTKRTSAIVNGLLTYTDKNVTFKGVIQPLQAKAIALKPEGQRAWKWLQIHSFSSTKNLDTNDQIIYNGVLFKVMAEFDYSLNGYIEYHAVAEYQP